MSFFSIQFLVFLTITVFIYYLIPKQCRYIWLLLVNYLFYASWSFRYIFVLLSITLISYETAKLISNHPEKKKGILGIGTAALVMVLCLFKYWKLWLWGISSVYKMTGNGSIEISVLMPVGISFYTLAAIGYVADVYRGNLQNETHFLKYAVFISFFPVVLSGPIERGKNVLHQIKDGVDFSYEKAKKGLLMIAFGFFLKLLIANRISIIVDAAFNSYDTQTGATILIAVVLYGFQLYADFCGYSSIAIGIAHLLGFSVMENFRQPYFSAGVKEFWNRWHISLSSWLRDYIYIPLGGNRKGKIRQYLNLMLTFLVSGLWHGTGWHYIIWGGIHGAYQIISNFTFPFRKTLAEKSHINFKSFSFRFFQILYTFVLVDFAWLFFRAPSVGSALSIIRNIFCNLQLGNTITNRLYLIGFDFERFGILLIEMAVWFAVDVVHEKNISITAWMNRQNKAFRWGVYVIFGIVLIMGAIHDYGLDASTFIYTQF